MNDQTPEAPVQSRRSARPRASVGDNSIAKEQLKSIIERVERLNEEKKAVSDDTRDVFLEAKSQGYDLKALRTIIRMRAQDPQERRESEAVLETYMHAMGMI